jgi:signal transduction histidine kinase
MNVLVVEDSVELRARIVAAIAEVGSITQIAEAGTVSAALAALDHGAPDVVVLDLGLPDGSGMAVLERAKQDPDGTEVIVFTGMEGSMYRKHCLRAGAAQFLSKEGGVEPLQDAIRQLSADDREPIVIVIVDEAGDDDFGTLLRELRRAGFTPHWNGVTQKQELAEALDEQPDAVVWWRPEGRIDVGQMVAGQGTPLVIVYDDDDGEPALAAAAEAVRLRESEIGRVGAQVARMLAERRASGKREVLERQVEIAATQAAAGRLSLGLAHDVGNIVTAIQKSVSVLLRPPSEHAVLSEAQRIDQACGSLIGLARKLVRLGVPVRDQAAEWLEPDRIVRETLDLLARLLGRDVMVSIEVEPSTPKIRGCRTELEQILVNLALNARDAMERGGRLRVICSAGAQGELRLEFSDTGSGMDEDTRRRLFEPFYSTKTFGGGTGVGLATVKFIVERWGGTIDVQTSSAGTTFVLHLPAAA